MRIITCASYYGTGSSAVTDLLSEFDNCYSLGEHEFRFIHDPDGIRDLEYNLIENNNRHNTSNAIKRFIKFAKHFNGGIIRKGYKRYMGNTFMELTNDYIDKIVELKCESWWYYDRIEKGRVFNFIDSIIGKLGNQVFKTYGFSLMNLLHEQGFYSAIDKEKFYKYTKEYIQKIIECLNIKHAKFVMVDQLLPPSNLNDYLRYFDDIRIIVVDRDPRDIYLLEKYVWRGHVVPHKTVKDFCEWYKITRAHRKRENYNNEKIYLLKFEDLVYKYDVTIDKLIRFIGLDKEKHIFQKSYFNPTISINNTNLKRRYSLCNDEINYIETELEEYLYDFPQMQNIDKMDTRLF